MAWSKDGAEMVGVLSVRGSVRRLTSCRKASPSKVNSAPRRAWAFAGSGMASSWARV